MKKMNPLTRFEDAICSMKAVKDELEALLYKVGDSPVPPTEDNIMNVIIGMIELHEIRTERLQSAFEAYMAEEESIRALTGECIKSLGD